MKLCINCQHHRLNKHNDEHYCYALAKNKTCVVTGKQESEPIISCFVMREVNRCGKEGNLYLENMR